VAAKTLSEDQKERLLRVNLAFENFLMVIMENTMPCSHVANAVFEVEKILMWHHKAIQDEG